MDEAIRCHDTLRRILALQNARINALNVELGRQPINNWRFSKFELDNADVYTLLVNRNQVTGDVMMNSES